MSQHLCLEYVSLVDNWVLMMGVYNDALDAMQADALGSWEKFDRSAMAARSARWGCAAARELVAAHCTEHGCQQEIRKAVV